MAEPSQNIIDSNAVSQQKVADDAIADIDMDSIYAREQGSTMVLMGKNFEAGAGRRNNLFDHMSALLAAAVTPGTTPAK